MKRFVIYLVSLLGPIGAFVLAVDYANVCLIRASTGNSAYKMERLYTNPEPEEIAIVGSSRADGNFVPSIISPRCFDYGVSAMGIREIISILEVLQKRQTDAPVIVNFDPWGAFGKGSFVADYRLVPQSGKLPFADRIPGVRFFGALRKNLVNMMNARKSVSSVVDNGAQLLKTSRTAGEWKVIEKKLGVRGFVGDSNTERRFLEVLGAFSPRIVYVVICPCSRGWMAKFNGQKDLDAFLLRLAGVPNVRILNYFCSQKFSDADFADPTHFNLEGACKFSELICSQISTKYER